MSINPIGIRISGPLAGFAEGYGAELRQLGYAPASVRLQLKVLADLSDWLLSQGMAAADLRRSDLDCFLRHRRLLAIPDISRSGRCAPSLIIFSGLRSYRDRLPTHSWVRST